MPERNIDKLRRLRGENNELQQRIRNQNIEIARLHRMNHEKDAGINELSQAVDSLYAAVAIQYGSDSEDGTKTIDISCQLVKEALSQYTVRANRSTEQDQYHITVAKRE